MYDLWLMNLRKESLLISVTEMTFECVLKETFRNTCEHNTVKITKSLTHSCKILCRHRIIQISGENVAANEKSLSTGKLWEVHMCSRRGWLLTPVMTANSADYSLSIVGPLIKQRLMQIIHDAISDKKADVICLTHLQIYMTENIGGV